MREGVGCHIASAAVTGPSGFESLSGGCSGERCIYITPRDGGENEVEGVGEETVAYRAIGILPKKSLVRGGRYFAS